MAPSSLGAARVVALLASCALASAAVVGGTAKELQPTELASSAAADASGQAMHVSSIHSALSPYRELVHSLDNTDSTVSSDNTTNCLAEIIYDTIINNAVNFLENVSDSVGSTEKYMTMAILIGLIIVGLLLLLVGELFMRTTLVVSTSVVSFIFMLYLWNFILSNNDNDFVACTLPIIIAGACTALIVGTILCLMNKIISLTFFAFGAIIGVLAGFILRSVILASNPDIALNAYFDVRKKTALAIAAHPAKSYAAGALHSAHAMLTCPPPILLAVVLAGDSRTRHRLRLLGRLPQTSDDLPCLRRPGLMARGLVVDWSVRSLWRAYGGMGLLRDPRRRGRFGNPRPFLPHP